MTRLCLHSLSAWNGPAARPGFRPEAHGAGIVHIGVGAFHRAHQAAMTDDALAKHGGDWRIIGVSLRSREIAEDLTAQDGLYTLIENDAAGTSARVVAAIDRVIAADGRAALDALCDPAIRVVTLTVTEKGYGIDRASRMPDAGDPVVAADLGAPTAPNGVLGLLVASIRLRRAAGHVPFTVLSCDNLPENGAILRDGVIGFARVVGSDELADWIAVNICFPSSMVDRITPAATPETRAEALRQTGYEDRAAVETERFTQWVIEDSFSSGRPEWEAGGALFVPDVGPYERMKLTMLNGSHSMLAYAGFLVGRRLVRDVMADADLSVLVTRHIKAAAGVLRPLPGVDFEEYAAALAKRFANPTIAHETYQIATDGTQKLPQRIFQPALAAIDSGRDPRPFAFAAAMWMRFCIAQADDRTTYDLRDPRAGELAAAVAGAGRRAPALSDAIHRLPQLIPPRLGVDRGWRGAVEDVLSVALNEGCNAAIRREVGRATGSDIAPA